MKVKIYIVLLILCISGIISIFLWNSLRFKPEQELITKKYMQPYYVKENNEYGEMERSQLVLKTTLKHYTNYVVIEIGNWDIEGLKLKERLKAINFLILEKEQAVQKGRDGISYE